MIQFLNLNVVHEKIKDDMQIAYQRVYESCFFIQGKELEAFEQNYARLSHVNNVVGVSNGLDALVLALRALGIGIGDEVIIPSNTYIATALAVSNVGAIPIFVEPRIDTYNINPEQIEKAISKKTKAIIPVHLYGQACEMDQIMKIAVNYNLYVVEDNAQAHLSSYLGKMTGSFGHINATSFYPGKNLGALGDAGAITTNSNLFAKKVKLLRNYGSDVKYFNEEIGYNNRLDELQAAFLNVKLNYIEEWTKQRQQIAIWYNELLSVNTFLTLPKVHSSANHVYHLYVVRSSKRDSLALELMKNGIQTMIHYPIPSHLQKAYKHLGYEKGDFPIAEEIAKTCLSLPIWPGMRKEDVEYVSSVCNSFSN
jgi:dTDP-4-amino-4,6-dideoxygalactose transaminase